MSAKLLPQIESPADLHRLGDTELDILTHEIRDELVRVMSLRPAHFASNLGVVELCLALHLNFDFRRDRLIWDTGHQIYPHKLITGRYRQFDTIRTKGGLMGYPNPAESEYDLFMTGHAAASISCGLGLKVGDELRGEKDRHTVVVIGDGALPSGIAYEAMNNAGYLDKNLLVILNDNKMSICPRTGAVAQMLDRARLTGVWQETKDTLQSVLNKVPVVGPMAMQGLYQLRDGLKALLTGGMLFEELGFRYFGPIDGHSLPTLRRMLREVKDLEGPTLLHILTNKGHGVPEACEDPVKFHTPPVIEQVGPGRQVLSLKKGGSKAYTDAASAAIHDAMGEDQNVVVITAAMCQGNKLERVRDSYPERFFDVGICEAHAVGFAAGLAKTGVRPIVAIYSTFLQRSFDHLFQEVALQNLPVVFCLDRGGLAGPDGPTHHGVFDNTYIRLFPNFTVMAPGDEADVAPMLHFALKHPGPISMRYPKANLEKIARTRQPIELGKAEVYQKGVDGALIAYGTLFTEAVHAADRLHREHGLELTVINARFIKPLDTATILRAVREQPFVITLEEGTLEGGFGSAVLEAANTAGVDTRHIHRLGIPDRFIEHAERAELLADLGLDAQGIIKKVAVVREQLADEVPIRGRRFAVAPKSDVVAKGDSSPTALS
ncbi:MAG TPA: 1-deoxy-D-xylulose-5-phosphate synthase [Gemmatales bacterium]|nr:1-deoxy-D-xylulose-5-phosphate synthase [Gemmatales bacterium]HMP59919.1 1-deoxy-D-xylulose-5-phosphate synthase [Gemmatales bacterium]